MNDIFRKIAHYAAEGIGSPKAFIFAVLIVILWGVSGSLFKYSDTWQLVINTGTTIITFLMLFLVQNTQNRDAKAIHLKLDELIRAVKTARDTIIDIEEESDQELAELKAQFTTLSQRPNQDHSEKAVK